MRKTHAFLGLITALWINNSIAQNHNYLLDTSFNNSGYTIAPYMVSVHSIDKLSNSKIRITGSNTYSSDKLETKTVQFSQNGQLDTSFSGDGIEITRPYFFDSSNAIAINNAEMLVAGREYNGRDFNYKIIKLKSNGLADFNFANSGELKGNSNNASPWKIHMAQLSNGNFIFSTEFSNSTTSVKKVTPDGSTLTDYGDYENTSFYTSCKSASGKIFFAGIRSISRNQDNIYKFYNPDGTNLQLTYQDDNSQGGETIVSSTFDEVNQNFMILENYFTPSLGSAYHLKKFDSSGNFIKKYTFIDTDFNFYPEFIKAMGGYIYVIGFTNSGDLKIAKLDQNGNFIDSFGDNGIATIDINEGITSIQNCMVDEVDNSIYVASKMSPTNSVFVMKLKLSNNLNSDDFDFDNQNNVAFPNPSNSVFNIYKVVDSITVQDSTGKQLIEVENTDKIDLSEFQNGIYFLKLKLNNKVKTIKVIKQ